MRPGERCHLYRFFISARSSEPSCGLLAHDDFGSDRHRAKAQRAANFEQDSSSLSQQNT